MNLRQARKQIAIENGFKTWRLVISEATQREFIKMDESAYQLAGKVKKLRKPIVMGRSELLPCAHENETLRQGDGFIYKVCSDCGEQI